MTAEDVVFTVEALKSPDAAGAGAAAWADVTVEAVDEKTVRLTLGTPIGGVLAAATQPLLPAHLLADVPFADLATSDFARLPVGSGPFAITDVDDQRATLVPASGVMTPVEEDPAASAGAAPSMDSLATPVPASERQPSQRRTSTRSRCASTRTRPPSRRAFGAARWMPRRGCPPARLGELAKEDGIDRHAYPTTTLSTVLLNLRPGHKELRDPKVRAAMLAAIDRDALVSDVLGGNATRADALVPPTSWAYDATVRRVRRSTTPRRPPRRMQAAGWSKKGGKWVAPGGKGAYRLELLTVSPEANPRLASVAAYVRRLVEGVRVRRQPRRGARPRTSRPGCARATSRPPSWTSPRASSPTCTRCSRRPRSAPPGRTSPATRTPPLDPLLEAARKPGTPEERTAAWKALLAALATRQPLLPLAWNDEVMLARGLDGVTPRLIADTGDRYWDVLAWRLAADR